MNIRIGTDGTMKLLYTEDLGDLNKFGTPRIRRASHVEPDKKGRWWANLKPVGGPKLGPFKRRTEALRAEVEWIEKRVL